MQWLIVYWYVPVGVYIFFAILIGYIAYIKDRSFLKFFFLSILFSPIIVLIITIIMDGYKGIEPRYTDSYKYYKCAKCGCMGPYKGDCPECGSGLKEFFENGKRLGCK